MKTEVTRGEEFRPVTLKITCESQAELDAIYTLLDYSMLNQAVKKVFGFEPRWYWGLSDKGARFSSALITEIAKQIPS